MKGELIASAKPNDHKVTVSGRVYVYGRLRKRFLTNTQCTIHLLRQVAKVTLRRVQYIKSLEDGEESGLRW